MHSAVCISIYNRLKRSDTPQFYANGFIHDTSYLFTNVDVFTARCYVYRGVCYRRMSVCLSHASTVEMAKHIIKLFPPSGSHTISVFPHQTVWQHSDGNPLTGASNAAGRPIKNRDLRPISRFISEMRQDRAMVTMECE